MPAKAGIQAAVASCVFFAANAFAANPTIETQSSGVTVRLRGISAIDENTAWASGREGTVLRTLDGGQTWVNVSVPDAKALDFRDVEGFDASTAVVLSIGPGEQSRVYRTQDGGRSWTLALKNDDERAFFDCMVFKGNTGWMLGDPVDGRYQIRETQDGGRTWTLWKNGPEAMKDEAAFAASGTCIAHTASGQLVAVGGGAAARVHHFMYGEIWSADETRMQHRIPAAGIFSIATIGDDALLVGGDFENETQGSAAWMWFGRKQTSMDPLPPPRGYRSGAACFSKSLCIAVGPTGVDALDSPAEGTPTWRPLSDVGYDAIDRAGMTAWASGDKGRIAKITFASKAPQAAAAPTSTR
ncbi:WD40/YVTN/BNR-like repeat-containing protein [Noviluteimonas dokdonensis]|uniref:WD40/YVTN/BNR-like repeat-containing protein n=1 Tax=Noviluteimonas dokdonensis TaxID=414050 RepID=UPI00068A058B|nr:hypothetical protein [Lysobacter dokdonensis]